MVIHSGGWVGKNEGAWDFAGGSEERDGALGMEGMIETDIINLYICIKHF